MAKIYRHTADEIVVEFTKTDTFDAVLDAVRPFIEKAHDGPYMLVYLPAGVKAGDPMAQPGYFGLRKPE